MSDEETRQLRRSIVKSGDLITEKEQAPLRGTSQTFKELGICATCNNLEAFETEFGNKAAQCGAMRNGKGGILVLKSADPVHTCTLYWNRGYLRIQDMIGMAIMIDTKRKIGFMEEVEELDCQEE